MREKIREFFEKFGLEKEIEFYYRKLRENIMKNRFSKIEEQKKYITKNFKKRLGYEINFKKNPETFNQKLQFRKIYDNNLLYILCADKYAVREYVKRKIGEKYLVPLYLVTDKLTQEQWNELPTEFVAKANHNSGPVQIIRNKFQVDSKKIIKELNNQLKLDFGIITLEKWYSKIKPKIIIEKYLEHSNDTIEDFKFHIFNTENIFIEHIYERKNNQIFECFYDKNWNRIDIAIGAKIYNHTVKKPQNYEEMLKIAIKLAEDFEYARIDLYNIKGKIYFGEITFCGDCGFGKFTDEKWDYKFGKFWKQKKFKEEE